MMPIYVLIAVTCVMMRVKRRREMERRRMMTMPGNEMQTMHGSGRVMERNVPIALATPAVVQGVPANGVPVVATAVPVTGQPVVATAVAVPVGQGGSMQGLPVARAQSC